MRNSKIIFMVFLFTLFGCGKSPILNKVEKTTNNIVTSVALGETFESTKAEFSFKWTIDPSLDDLSSFDVTLKDPLTTNQTLNAYLWMPDMGHGSSPITVEMKDSLNYSFSELAFIMPGLWVLHLEILENNQVVDQWQKSITL